MISGSEKIPFTISLCPAPSVNQHVFPSRPNSQMTLPDSSVRRKMQICSRFNLLSLNVHFLPPLPSLFHASTSWKSHDSVDRRHAHIRQQQRGGAPLIQWSTYLPQQPRALFRTEQTGMQMWPVKTRPDIITLDLRYF